MSAGKWLPGQRRSLPFRDGPEIVYRMGALEREFLQRERGRESWGVPHQSVRGRLSTEDDDGAGHQVATLSRTLAPGPRVVVNN